MGQHTERLRELLKAVPNSSGGFTPQLASMMIRQIINASLQIVAELEERLEDSSAKNDRMIEMMLEKGIVPDWTPKEGE